MLYLLRKQIILCLLTILSAFAAMAQRELYRPDHDNVPFYFGASFSYNSASIHPSKHPRFTQYDSVLTAEPGSGGGIALGFLATAKLIGRLEVRTNPQLIMGGGRTFTYTLKYPNRTEEETVIKRLPSTIVTFPFQLKFNSDRIDNFRVYAFGGVKMDIDLASNAAARNAEDMIKLNKYDYGVELGIGFNFFTPFVTVSPEIKFSSGLANLHARDANLKYSNIFDKLQSRMVFISINLED
jgi:hypothetical protein